MSLQASRSSDSFGVWLILSSALAVCAGLFAAARVKPPILFALGFGAVIGLTLRFLAAWLSVPLVRRTVAAAVILAAVGFGVSFSLGYRRAALDREQMRASLQGNAALAEALLQQFPDKNLPALLNIKKPFGFQDYLSQRLPGWPSPWPEVIWGAEWTACILTAGLCLWKWKRAAPVR